MVSDITYSGLYINIRDKFRASLIASPELEARLIAEKASGKTRAEYIKNNDSPVPDDVLKTVEVYVKRRLAGEPVAYILGEWEFYSLPFFVNSDTLIPRTDSEVLVSEAIRLLKSIPSPRVLDLCSGSGCLGIAVSKNIDGVLLTLADISTGALLMSEKNAALNGVSATHMGADALQSPPDGLYFDMILCNPPYIQSADINTLDISVRGFEPVLALDGGDDGLIFYHKVAPLWKKALVSGGYMLFECGTGQASDVRDILAREGFSEIASADDTAGITRVVIGRK